METVAEPARPELAHDAPDAAACDRCGTFAPLSMRWGKRWCAACLARRSRIETAPISLANLITDTFLLFQQVAFQALLITLITSAIDLWIRLSKGSFLIGLVYEYVVIVAARMTIQRLAFVRVVRQPEATLGAAFAHVRQVFPRAWATMALDFLISSLFALLLVVPGIVRTFSYFIADPLALVTPFSPMQCLDWSRKLMQGRRAVTATAVCLIVLGPMAALSVVLIGAGGLAGGLGHAIAGLGERPVGIVGYIVRLTMPLCFIPGHLMPIVLLLKLGHRFTEQSGPSQGG